jgi:hypothetical protein
MASSSTSGSDAGLDIMCVFCGNILDAPVSLGCGHAACLGCADRRKEPPAQGRGASVSCKACGTRTVLGPSGCVTPSVGLAWHSCLDHPELP